MKNLLLFLFLFMLLLPAIEKTTNIPRERLLSGVFIPTAPDSLNLENWNSGLYQQHFVKRFDETIGYKPTLVRLYNQVDFTLFGQSGAKYILIGKSEYLYSMDDVNACIGKYKTNGSELKKKLGYVYQVQKYLEARGIHFIFIFAPSKARIYKDFLPARYLGSKKRLSNYDEYRKIIKQDFPDLHVLDINTYFGQLRRQVTFPLYSTGGMHWSNYAAHKYFLDTLLQYMGHLQKKKISQTREDNLHWSDSLQSPDNDLRKTMNLFASSGNVKLPYADFTFITDQSAKKPRLLVIADSYYSLIYQFTPFTSIFGKTSFWYYNKTRFPEEYYKKTTDPVFLRDDLLNQDFVILMATEENLKDLFLFPESAVSLLGLGNAETREQVEARQERIKFYINAMLNNPQWLNQVKIKAQQTHQTLEQMLQADAEYMQKLEDQRNHTK